MHNPPHPGLVLREYLGDLPVSKAAMAIRLAAALGTTPELWMNMQSQYDLWQAKQRRQPGGAKVCACCRGVIILQLQFRLRGPHASRRVSPPLRGRDALATAGKLPALQGIYFD